MQTILVDVDTQFDFVDPDGALFVPAASGVSKAIASALTQAPASGQPILGSVDSHAYDALFILPGYRFRSVDAMLTNFHLPQSSLLMLVSSFAGSDRVLRAYQHAVQEKYRFFSYGDAMFLTPDSRS